MRKLTQTLWHQPGLHIKLNALATYKPVTCIAVLNVMACTLSIYLFILCLSQWIVWFLFEQETQTWLCEQSNASAEPSRSPVGADLAAMVKHTKEKEWKYSDESLKFGFMFKRTDCWVDNVCHLLCCVGKLIYKAIRSAASLGGNLYPRQDIQLKSLQSQRTFMRQVSELALKALYLVAFLIAEEKRHTFAWDLILPAASEIWKTETDGEAEVGRGVTSGSIYSFWYLVHPLAQNLFYSCISCTTAIADK